MVRLNTLHRMGGTDEWGRKMAEIETAKLISYVKIDFSTESELELYINMFEKEGESFWLQLKEIGLLRWRINRVWNKRGGFELSQIFEYKDENSFIKGQELLADILESKKDFLGKINFKRTAFRNINIFDYYE